MKELLKKGSIVVMLGTGGVGKTTISAALGLAAARAGLNTALITVDPARRLREALGLPRLSAQPTRLDKRRLRSAELDGSIQLSAMTLDVKHTWDGLVEQLVESSEARGRILENPFYRNLTQQFAGAEAYAALEQLDELHRSAQFDILIVDTPPAAHAFEFFEAPRHLVELLDSSAARWLFTPETRLSRNALSVASRAARFVVSQLESFTGTRTLSAISDFFALAAEAAGALSERFHKTEALMRSRNVSFVLVTTPREDRLNHALELAKVTRQHRFRLAAIVLNRMLDERTFGASQGLRRGAPAHLDEIARLHRMLDGTESRLNKLVEYLEHYRESQLSDIQRAARFANKLPARITLAITPAVDAGVRDLRSLATLSSILIDSPAGRKFLGQAANTPGVAPSREHTSRQRSIL
ncbi:MAG TPA: ArsA-related P-loop ATPase [Candidatus Binataceae bacterium]|nr:ArsA-related P-loop ATPase [Candidatus Binataceae bacterium]